ncbi:mandelate racemase/muconate lactonizing enzyme family protein [Microlunatus speluncae]|uniref:mandelate racemase/muconate lactonizing enzyme family protein n=1 Tax=Microlunatus speluncae TaxID=2594267 RepID=UPI001266200C|nr:enolase C-terminal domain-like protein [Microlunatus speluncae]
MSTVITKLETFVVPVPFRHAFVIGSGPVGGAAATGDVIFVKLTTGDGVVGWGEQRALPSWSYETADTILTVINKELAPLLIGADPFAIEGFHRAADKALSPSVSNGFPFARAAVDLALHDLAGKLAAVPVHALLGGAVHQELALCSAIGIDTPEAMVDRVRSSADYHAYKIKIRGDVAADAAALRAITEPAAGKPIWLDANQSYRPSALHQLLRQVGDLPGLHCVEQPVPSTDWAGMIKVRERTDLPVAIDEGSFSAADLARTAVLGAADLVVIKICKAGGLRPALRTAAVAKAHGLEILSSGLTDTGVGFAAALHLFSLLDLALPAELNGPELLSELYVEGLEIDDAIATVPNRPGLGVEVDEDRIRATAREL